MSTSEISVNVGTNASEYGAEKELLAQRLRVRGLQRIASSKKKLRRRILALDSLIDSPELPVKRSTQMLLPVKFMLALPRSGQEVEII
jgi:hypothetical protein